MNSKILMTPGPTEVSAEALKQLAQPMKPHFGKEWVELYSDVIAKLKIVFNTDNDIIVLTASSSAAIECAISSVIEPGEKVLICHNGFFAERIKEIVISWGGEPVLLYESFYQAIYPMEVEKVLNTNKSIRSIVWVHNETSTGVVNPVKAICKIANEQKIISIVDSVSGIGGSDFQADNWNVDIAITGSQKCLEAPAGLSFLSVSNNAWEKIHSRKSVINGWYLNLNNINDYREKWADWHPQGPNTASVSLYLALNASLDKIIQEGLNERIDRHKRMAFAFRQSIKSLGLKLFANELAASNTLTSFLLDKNINAPRLLELMENEHNIILAGDLGYVDKQLIRVGHMGITASKEYLSPTLVALEKTLETLNFPFKERKAFKLFNDLTN